MQENDPPINEDYDIPSPRNRKVLTRKGFRKRHDPEDQHYSNKGGHFEGGKHQRFKKQLAQKNRDDSLGR
jgi:hypothetical protein